MRSLLIKVFQVQEAHGCGEEDRHLEAPASARSAPEALRVRHRHVSLQEDQREAEDALESGPLRLRELPAEGPSLP